MQDYRQIFRTTFVLAEIERHAKFLRRLPSSVVACLSILILCIVSPFLLRAQPFGPQIALSGGATGQPQHLVVDDIDSDGLPDVAVSGIPGIVWYQNLGGGEFELQETLIGDFPNAEFLTGDFTGDLLPDILLAHENHLCWYENLGNGCYDTMSVINDLKIKPRYLHACDLDVDGDLDFIVAYWPHEQSCWYENDGNGNFTDNGLIAPSYQGRVVEIWDKDIDGDPDLVIHSSMQLSWLENDGQGQFLQIHSLVSGSLTWLYETGDMDLDGDDDLIVHTIGENSRQLHWLENFENPNLGLSHFIADISLVNTIECADLDLDGDMDLLSGSYDSHGIKVYENLGDGSFAEGEMIFFEQGVTGILSRDFDLDGVPDFVNLCQVKNRVTWYKNEGSFSFSGPLLLTSITQGACCVLSADMDGDDDPDIISVSSGDRKLAYFPNKSDGSFGYLLLINDTVIMGVPVVPGAVAHDFDKDGHYDLAIHGVYNYILKNDGAGNFDQVQQLDHGNEAENMAICDLNSDGFEDILLASYSSIQWYENLRNGQFSEKRAIDQFGWYGNSTCAGDLDGNGTLDVIYTSEEYCYVYCKLNDGAGNFSERIRIMSTSSNPIKIDASDLDLDNDDDIVVSLNEKLVWYENTGSNSWSDERLISNQIFNGIFYLTDLDNDSNTDILASDSTGIIWFENTGDGQFHSAQLIGETESSAGSLYTMDLDGDGDHDLLAAMGQEGKIAWYENLRNPLYACEQRTGQEILVSPCPARDHLNLRLNTSNLLKEGDIHVLSIDGRKVLHEFIISGEQQIDVSSLVPGLYILTYTGDQMIFSARFIKL